MNIKEIRQKYYMSQADICRRFGIPTRTISAWEAGDRHAPDYLEKMIDDILYYENKYGSRYEQK